MQFQNMLLLLTNYLTKKSYSPKIGFFAYKKHPNFKLHNYSNIDDRIVLDEKT